MFVFRICHQLTTTQLAGSKEVVHELEFGNIAVMQILTICSRVTRILILIDSLGCLKKVKTIDMIVGKCKFPNSFLPYFQLHML